MPLCSIFQSHNTIQELTPDGIAQLDSCRLKTREDENSTTLLVICWCCSAQFLLSVTLSDRTFLWHSPESTLPVCSCWGQFSEDMRQISQNDTWNNYLFFSKETQDSGYFCPWWMEHFLLILVHHEAVRFNCGSNLSATHLALNLILHWVLKKAILSAVDNVTNPPCSFVFRVCKGIIFKEIMRKMKTRFPDVRLHITVAVT